MTPSSAQGAGAAPLMGTAGVTDLFFPAIDEEEEERAADAPAAADGRAPEQRLCARPAAGGESKEEPHSEDAAPAKEACASHPRPEGCGSRGTACAMEAQTPPAAEVTPTGDDDGSAGAGVDSVMTGESEEVSTAGNALAIVVSPELATRHSLCTLTFLILCPVTVKSCCHA